MDRNIDLKIKDFEKRIYQLESALKEKTDALSRRLTIISDAIEKISGPLLGVIDSVEAHKIDIPRVWEYMGLSEKRFKTLEKHDEIYGRMFENLRRSINIHAEVTKGAQIDLREKLNEVYYQVFPERLAKDIQVIKQLKALTSKPPPDAGPKKA